MSISRHTMHADHKASSEKQDVWSPQRLRHEWANLLDGSLRHLSLAIRQLNDQAKPAARLSRTDVVKRLEMVRQSLERMAELLPDQEPEQSTKPTHAANHPSQSITELIDQLIAWVKPIAEEQDVQLHTQIEGDLQQFPANTIEPILSNALRNCLDAFARASSSADHPKLIEIIVRRHGDGLRIEVLDTGPGIDAALFNNDQRFNFGQTTRGPSHGRGLALSADLAKQLGGSLTLSNRSQRGARLTLDLPWPATSRLSA